LSIPPYLTGLEKVDLTSKKSHPKYSGIRTYLDPQGRFLFRYPSDWHQHELMDDRDGVMYSPEVENPETFFAIWAVRLEEKVVAEDIDILREGVDEGLFQLPGLNIESASDRTFGNLIRFERIYTFAEGEVTRQRKAWMIYVYRWLFVLVAQGASAEAYDYWYMMLNDFFGTFDLAHELWYASDRELASDLA
jgi:hypothetical protein